MKTFRDGCLARVARAVDVVIASPHRDELMLGVLESLITLGTSCHRFEESDGWTPATARGAVLALASNVPEPMLMLMAELADKEVKWVTSWDRRGWLESEVPGGQKMTLPQLKRAYAERAAAKESA